MANDTHRSRSNTSISSKSTRPVSRASTTSVNSFSHDQSHDQQQLQYQYQLQHPHQPHPLQQNALAYQQNGGQAPLDAALLQAAQQASQQDIMPTEQVQQLMGYSGESLQGTPNGLPLQAFSQDPHGVHGLQASLHQHQHSVPMDVDEKKKKGSASGSVTNDRELREMLNRNDGRALKDVAAEVIATDRTSKAEKSKQLFAMLWLKDVCRKAKTSVPRNRVYSKYADRCADERVIPLNPASFGKLVRVIFPNIATRRLGVRGESKYHYVDLALINDTDDGEDGRRSTAPNGQHPPRRPVSVGPQVDFNSAPRVPADTTAFPAQEQSLDTQSSYATQGTSQGRLFTDLFSTQFQPTASHPTAPSYEYTLKFPTPEQLSAPDNFDIRLPDITPYLPPRTDSDAAGALVTIYRTHCTSLVDAVRYCKEKQFFRLWQSFQGTMTVPVQKLYCQPELAPWIKECDIMMYQKMIRNLSQLALQVAPAPVLKFLDSVAKNLHFRILQNCVQFPLHVQEARLQPASTFALLINQMIRVNSTAHAAAVLLMGDQNRDHMWSDWSSMVNIKRVVQNELPTSCLHEDVYKILSTEIRGMLLPLSNNVAPDGSLYPEPSPDSGDITNETVIDRIAAFLVKLPSRFPDASARTILHCVNAVGSAALREITVENGGSFQGWWLTKVFIDEMGHWLAALGGFLSHNLSPPTPAEWSSHPYSLEAINASLANGGSGSNGDSRYSSIDAEFPPEQSFISTNGSMHLAGSANTGHNTRQHSGRYDSVSFGLDLDLATSQQEPNHDDSGIALNDSEFDAKFASLASYTPQLPAGVS